MVYIQRIIEKQVGEAIDNYPVTAIVGPRQCGKSTMVQNMLSQRDDILHLDLERPSDLIKLENAEWFFQSQKGKLICIDEVQRRPDLFPVIRSISDEWNKNGSFLILGSASRDLLKQSSETLAGRIAYKRLTPFLFAELQDTSYDMEQYFSKGGFPRSLISKNENISFEWRENFISTFLERDLLQWQNFTPATMRRLLLMLAHLNGQTINYTSISNSLGVSNQTIKNYVDLLESTFMVDVVPPYISNLGKRLVKAPKIYIADSGITAALLGLQNFNTIMGHPASGTIWEQIVLTNLKGLFPSAEFFYYRTTAGVEMDFVMLLRGKIIAIECKATYSPSLTKGAYSAIEDIMPAHTFVVTPSPESWQLKKGIDVTSLHNIQSCISAVCQ
ncbi:MAG: ATP-binding protein [Bacteroidales bacterium]|jgi:predicted AAA+ superfamily ATPase|nr:ATP-binding protein [Bacteroidales bacterium]